VKPTGKNGRYEKIYGNYCGVNEREFLYKKFNLSDIDIKF